MRLNPITLILSFLSIVLFVLALTQPTVPMDKLAERVQTIYNTHSGE
jgi:hypothetical protein